MLRIGLTGGIGSGKTTVSEYFESLYNIPIIDADEISRELVLPHGEAYNEVIDLFGDESVLESGEIDRKFIREKIFISPELRTSLEEVIHPKVKASIINKTNTMSDRYCLIVIPLLIESSMQSLIDRTLVIQTSQSLQLSRVAERDQCTEAHVKTIIDTQLSDQERIKYADDIIVNDGTHEDLIHQISQLHQKYLALSQ